MNQTVRILIVEDDPTDAELMVRELKRDGLKPVWVRVQTEAEYLEQLERAPEVILSDSKLPMFDGLEALDLLKQRGLDIPFILVSGRMGEDLAVEAMKRGACDYLLKDRLARLGEAVRRAIEERWVREEREWAIGALRRSEERYRLVSEASSDYVYSLRVDPDRTLKLEWVTDPFVRITGYDAADLNQRGLASLLYPEDEAIAAPHRESLLAGNTGSIEVRIVTKDKRVRWIRVHERPVFSEGERSENEPRRVARIYGAAQDITERKELEEQLLQSRKMEAIGQLAGGVAHDFNNLLTVICGYGDLMLRLPGLNETGREFAQEILEAAKRASQLTRQLLAFGRRQTLQMRTLNLNTVVSDLEKMLGRLIGEDVELRTAYTADLGLVKADPGQIEQVIMNLVVNARDAMPAGGRLTIETANAGAQVMLAVSDTGTGMDSETAARVFEPFFTTKEVGKGTGLGLAMAYGIVKQSGGDIRVESEPGRGATFRIFLPRLDRTAAEQPPEPVPFELRPTQARETILVLEDDGALRSLIRQVLRNAGHEVLDTGDPEQAIELCESHPGEIALLITDVVLPKMSGPQVAERVRELRPETRIIYTTGYPGRAAMPNGALLNGNFFEKPFTPGTLVAKVRAVLDEGRTE
jgi:two-component system, cell cycle sensor histidine kinase and response regulator CckA